MTARAVSATIGTVSHSVPAGLSSGAGVGGSSPLTTIQLRADRDVVKAALDVEPLDECLASPGLSTHRAKVVKPLLDRVVRRKTRMGLTRGDRRYYG